MSERTTVAIIGAGISGLTFANICERAGIPYVLWERQNDILTAAGAGIMINPCGLRVLDQIGVYEQLAHETQPLKDFYIVDGEGHGVEEKAFKRLESRIGYSARVMRRQHLQEVLFASLEDKSTLVTSKQVASITESEDCAVVTAVDGTKLKCDIVVGADGVHSSTRQSVEKLSTSAGAAVEEPDYLSSRYAGVYGTCTAIPSLPVGTIFVTYRKELSMIYFAGCDNDGYYGITSRLHRTYKAGEAPHFTQADIDACLEQARSIQITENVKFEEAVKTTTYTHMSPLETGAALHWHSRRIALVGDAAHRLTPAGGMGGNEAIQSCAALMNALSDATRDVDGVEIGRNHSPSAAAIRTAFNNYTEKRLQHSKLMVSWSLRMCAAELNEDDGEFYHEMSKISSNVDLEEKLKMMSKGETLHHCARQTTRTQRFDDCAATYAAADFGSTAPSGRSITAH